LPDVELPPAPVAEPDPLVESLDDVFVLPEEVVFDVVRDEDDVVLVVPL
jgi:hypothetical protein